MFGVYQGASNHEELHNLMKATTMIRRLKKDVLSELPVKRRQQVCTFIAIFSLQSVFMLFDHFFSNARSLWCNLKVIYCIWFIIDFQVFLDLADKDMKQINALFREVIQHICCTSWDEGCIIQFCYVITQASYEVQLLSVFPKYSFSLL